MTQSQVLYIRTSADRYRPVPPEVHWSVKASTARSSILYPAYEHSMNDEVLIDTEEEIDLGVTIP